MTVSDEKRQTLEAGGTASSTLFAATALSAALLIAQFSASVLPLSTAGVRFTRTPGTLAQPRSLHPDELDLLIEINRVYDDLLRHQVELDAESRYALYSNLWDLYE